MKAVEIRTTMRNRRISWSTRRPT